MVGGGGGVGSAGVGKKFFGRVSGREREQWEDGGATSCLTDALTTVVICKRLLRQDGGCFLLITLFAFCHTAHKSFHSFFIIFSDFAAAILVSVK